MKFDDKGKVDPISTGLEIMQTIVGDISIPEYTGLREMEPHNSLAVNYGMGDQKRVEALVKQYQQDPKFMEVANALLGKESVSKIING